jgi:nucleoside-diphosphate-sugar epimerase
MIEAGLIEPIVKVGNLESLRTWADVRDAVKAYHMLVTCNPVPGAYYNIGGNYSCTIRQMLLYLLSISKVKNITIREDKERIRPIDADLQIPDINKFKKHTGWQPEISFEKTMLDLLDYWRERVESKNQFLVR